MKIEIEDMDKDTYMVSVDFEGSMYHGDNICANENEVIDIVENVLIYEQK